MTAIDFAVFVDRLASVSGETIRPFFRTALGVENKSLAGGFDPVTAADRAAEVAMRTLIKKTFPAHGIIGEELGAERADAEYVWVLDPIDGTKSFICGLPAWGTLIALTRRGEPIYGMMHQPFTREHFTGDGSAARYRGPAGDPPVLPCHRSPSVAPWLSISSWCSGRHSRSTARPLASSASADELSRFCRTTCSSPPRSSSTTKRVTMPA